jgi:hypothetical protein
LVSSSKWRISEDGKLVSRAEPKMRPSRKRIR